MYIKVNILWLAFKSLAYTLVYSDPNATLQDEAVTKAFEKVQAKLVEEFKADIR